MEVAEGKAFYISVPKLKTNLYTQVTLGFKNAMGIIPYALRERNHNYLIDEKLTDLLYLIRPHLTLIDGLVGGEGNTPRPGGPGWTAGCSLPVWTRWPPTGWAPGSWALTPTPSLCSSRRKSGAFSMVRRSWTARAPVFHFRAADASLLGEPFHRHFPNVLVLAGHSLPHAPRIQDPYSVTPELARQLEGACRGGCLAALRSGFEYVGLRPQKGPEPGAGGGHRQRRGMGRPALVVRPHGKPYSEKEVRALELPLLTLGNCAENLADAAKWRTPGCCSPSVCMLAATAAMGIPFPLLSLKNQAFFPLRFSRRWRMALTRCFCLCVGCGSTAPASTRIRSTPLRLRPPARSSWTSSPGRCPKWAGKMRLKLAGDQLRILKL